jgi:hypothetical protein
MFALIFPLLEKTEAGKKSIRLLGVRASNFEKESSLPKQLVFDFFHNQLLKK